MVVFLAMCLVVHFAQAFPPQARCSACTAMVDETFRILDFNAQKKTSKAYSMQTRPLKELEALEVVEKICPSLRGYTLVEKSQEVSAEQGVGKYEFQRVGNWYRAWNGQERLAVDEVTIRGGSAIGSVQDMYEDYELELFCGKMLELFEEEYVDALQKSASRAALKEQACVRIFKSCDAEEYQRRVVGRAKRAAESQRKPKRRRKRRK